MSIAEAIKSMDDEEVIAMVGTQVYKKAKRVKQNRNKCPKYKTDKKLYGGRK